MLKVSYASIEEAEKRIRPHIRKSPLLRLDYASDLLGREILLKCEMMQKTGSFKIRGAANCILTNMVQAKKQGVVAASAGNHAQGVAAICKHLGIKSTIFMPVTTPAIKVQNTQRWGAEVRLEGEIYDESSDLAIAFCEEKGCVFVSPFKDSDVIAGQGTIALELLEDPTFSNIEAVVVAVGGGGLITGIATALKAKRPEIKIYAVSAKNAPSMWKSYHEKTLCHEPVHFTLAEGVAAKQAEKEMLELFTPLISDFFVMSEESIAHSVALLAEHGKMICEGAGALPLAATLEGRIPESNITLILSGGNIDLTALESVLQHGLAEQDRLIHLIITISDRPGGLNSLTNILAKEGANILQIFHQRNVPSIGFGQAKVEVALETRGRDHTHNILSALKRHSLNVQRVS